MGLMTPRDFQTSKHRRLSFPGPAQDGAISISRLSPADNSLVFAKVVEGGVAVWSSPVDGERFRVMEDPAGDDNTLALVESMTPWLEAEPYLHTDPRWGERVTYYIDVQIGAAWSRIGAITLDLAGYVLPAPVIDPEESFFNAPFLHVALVWPGEAGDLQHFEVEVEENDAWRVWMRGPGTVFHGQTILPGPVRARARAIGISLGPSPWSAVIDLADQAAAGGTGQGAPDLRSRQDHRNENPNLIKNSSFENQTNGVPLSWDVSGQVVLSDDWTWFERHGDHHVVIPDGATIRQTIPATGSSSDLHSFSVLQRSGNGNLRVLSMSGAVLGSVPLGAGLVRLEAVRVPSTDAEFFVEIAGPCEIDQVMCNQGATVDPWQPHNLDRFVQVELELIARDAAIRADIQQVTDTMQSDLTTVFDLLGGQSGATITNHGDSIDAIVAALNGDNSAAFTWIQQTADAIELQATDIQTNAGAISGATTQLGIHTTRIDGNETGLASLGSDFQLLSTAINHNQTGLAAAHSRINMTNVLIGDLDGEIQTIESTVSVHTAAVNDLLDTQTAFNTLSSIFYDNDTGFYYVRSEAETATSWIDTTGQSHQTSITQNSNAITSAQGDILALENKIVLEAISNGDGTHSLAQIELGSGAPQGSNIALRADNIDFIGQNLTFTGGQIKFDTGLNAWQLNDNGLSGPNGLHIGMKALKNGGQVIQMGDNAHLGVLGLSLGNGRVWIDAEPGHWSSIGFSDGLRYMIGSLDSLHFTFQMDGPTPAINQFRFANPVQFDEGLAVFNPTLFGDHVSGTSLQLTSYLQLDGPFYFQGNEVVVDANGFLKVVATENLPHSAPSPA